MLLWLALFFVHWTALEGGHLNSRAPPTRPDAARGTGFFVSQTDRLRQNPVMRAYGISIVDTNDDGKFEAFVCGYGHANLLYESRADGLHDIAAQVGVQYAARRAIGVASCDMDNDGMEEIYVLNTDAYGGDKQHGDHILRRTSPNGMFTDLFSQPQNQRLNNGFAGRSVACVDRTGQGRYEVGTASYSRQLHLYGVNVQGMVTDMGGPGKIGFEGITGGRGITGGPLCRDGYAGRPGMDVVFGNEGGWNSGCNFLFCNDGDGAFTESAAQWGLRDCLHNVRGITLLDGNHDGRMDIAYGNWYSDVAPGSMAEPTPIRTVIVADFDNDGLLEMFHNNIVYDGSTAPNKLFQQHAGGWRPLDIGDALELEGYGTGAGVYDADSDGVLDLLVAHGESGAQQLTFFRARDPTTVCNRFVRVLPVTSAGAPARGATVSVAATAATPAQKRVVDPGSGYLCQMEPVAHFGFGRLQASDVTVVVGWVDGTERQFRLALDKMYRVRPDGTLSEVPVSVGDRSACVGLHSAAHHSPSPSPGAPLPSPTPRPPSPTPPPVEPEEPHSHDHDHDQGPVAHTPSPTPGPTPTPDSDVRTTSASPAPPNASDSASPMPLSPLSPSPVAGAPKFMAAPSSASRPQYYGLGSLGALCTLLAWAALSL